METGSISGEKLLAVFNFLRSDRKAAERVARANGLQKHEIEAVWSYSQANKELAFFAKGVANPCYMNKKFGDFRNGWEALLSGLCKIPSFGRLGLTASTFRTVRNRAETDALRTMNIGTRIVLGCLPMPGGQYHVASSALTMSKWTEPGAVKASGGVICYFGSGGVPINWLGEQSMAMDGGETLYRPGTVMQLSAKCSGAQGYDHPSGQWPIFVLEEIPDFEEGDLTGKTYVDDFTYKPVDADQIRRARSAASSADILNFNGDGDLHRNFAEG